MASVVAAVSEPSEVVEETGGAFLGTTVITGSTGSTGTAVAGTCSDSVGFPAAKAEVGAVGAGMVAVTRTNGNGESKACEGAPALESKGGCSAAMCCESDGVSFPWQFCFGVPFERVPATVHPLRLMTVTRKLSQLEFRLE
jgi:hypothetical protein